MARSLPLKMRVRMGKKRRGPSTVQGRASDSRLRKLEGLEKRLENVSEEIETEIKEIERLEGPELRKAEFAWIQGGGSLLLLQDFVGASFGAVFFAVTGEVWDIAARSAPWQTFLMLLMGFAVGYSLVYASRKRKTVSQKVYSTVFFRCVELFVVSFVVAVFFVVVLATAPSATEIFKQAAIITMPAVVSAATADLLFY